MSIHIYTKELIVTLDMEIRFYNHLVNLCICPMEKLYYYRIIKDKTNCLLKLAGVNLENCTINKTRKTFTLNELSYYDGASGKPAYVAINNNVYDVSMEATWGGASHFGLTAGKDLTNEFNSCHNNSSILNKLPLVGSISK